MGSWRNFLVRCSITLQICCASTGNRSVNAQRAGRQAQVGRGIDFTPSNEGIAHAYVRPQPHGCYHSCWHCSGRHSGFRAGRGSRVADHGVRQCRGDDNLYVYTDWSLGVPNTPLTLTAHLGYTDGVLAPPFLTGAADDSGLDWSIGASMPIHGGLSLGVSYVGVEGPSVNDFTDDAIVATLSFAG